MASLERFKQVTLIIFLLFLLIISLQFFTEELLLPLCFFPSVLDLDWSLLLERAEHLDIEANAALQALLLVTSM